MEKRLFFGKEVSIEFIKFCIVGIFNTFIHLAILYCLTEFFGVYYVVASFIGFVTAVTNSFIFNTLWTFKKNIKERTTFRYSKFFIISSLAALINLGLLYIVTEFLGILYILSQIIATGFSLMVNYIGNKFWTYK